MRSIPVEWLAMGCRADTGHRTTNALQGGTDLSLGVKNFAMATLFDPTGFDAICLMASEILPCRLSASSTRHYSQAQRVIQMF